MTDTAVLRPRPIPAQWLAPHGPMPTFDVSFTGGDGMDLTLHRAGCEVGQEYGRLKLDCDGVAWPPACGSTWECEVVGVESTGDLSLWVRVRPVRPAKMNEPTVRQTEEPLP